MALNLEKEAIFFKFDLSLLPNLKKFNTFFKFELTLSPDAPNL